MIGANWKRVYATDRDDIEKMWNFFNDAYSAVSKLDKAVDGNASTSSFAAAAAAAAAESEKPLHKSDSLFGDRSLQAEQELAQQIDAIARREAIPVWNRLEQDDK